MAKQRFVFQVEFNLNVNKGEIMDLSTLAEFKRALTEFVKQGYEEDVILEVLGGQQGWEKNLGGYTRDVHPSAVKVRMVDTSKV